MEMRRLEAFCKVVEHHSFTRAAEMLSLSQPTVSEHVRVLEEELNEKLVNRFGRVVEATPAGRLLYEYARKILDLRDESMQALQDFKGDLSGRLKIGASTIPGTYLLPKLIGRFKLLHPGIQIMLRIADSAEVVEQLINSEVEAGFIGAQPRDRRVLSRNAYKDELILAVHPEHAWRNRSQIDFMELQGQPFIMREDGSGTRSVIMKILEEQDFPEKALNIVAEMGSTEAVKQSIKAGIGISILSKYAVEEDLVNSTLHKVAVSDLDLTRPIFLIERKNRRNSPVCAAFLEFILNANDDIT